VLIEELIRKEKVKLHFHREGMIIGKGASSTDILRWDFSVMGAEASNTSVATASGAGRHRSAT
jgi:hypothetical protein